MSLTEFKAGGAWHRIEMGLSASNIHLPQTYSCFINSCR